MINNKSRQTKILLKNPDQSYYDDPKSIRKIPSQNKILNSNLNKLSRELQIELEREMSEICIVQSEIEKCDMFIYDVMQTHSQIIGESIERKTKFNLLKKEIDMKKIHLTNVMKIEKIREDESIINQKKRIESLIGGINHMTLNINSHIEFFDLNYEKIEVLEIPNFK